VLAQPSHQRTSACGKARPCFSSDADTRPSCVPAPTVATPPETDTATTDMSITNPRLTERPAKQWPPLRVAHSNPCRPTKRPDRPSFSINLTAGAYRKLPLPASFGSCPQYRCTRRSTDPYKDTRSAQRTGQAGGIRPRHIVTALKPRSRLDLPIDESLLYGARTAAWAACPRPPPACPVLESHALTFSMASLFSTRFRAMRSVQPYT
jgi:hypothetical protein